ncbi:hypothetical protein GBA52_021377 [Prunus armeniaca]|nr:hypothetical protein GBA52_021377 [Prunus armeniaca]
MHELLLFKGTTLITYPCSGLDNREHNILQNKHSSGNLHYATVKYAFVLSVM